MRITRAAVLAAGGAVTLAGLLPPTAIAHADVATWEKEVCHLMDDPAGRDEGYAPAEYAFMMLRAKMSAEDARTVMSQGVQDYCPNHVIDLPASWR